MDSMNRGMKSVTAVLAKCAQSDREMSVTLARVADTMQEVAGFVTDIEEIGTEIDLIALNAQVKAAHTGQEGAALGVLAEAIKRLSVESITQTELVSQTLLQINSSTNQLFQEASEETEQLGSRVADMEEELTKILSSLGSMNRDLIRLMNGLNSRVSMLSNDVESATSGIDVQDRVKSMSDEVVESLDSIVARARELEPASPEFKDNLRHMEERYTMDSERHIHEAIARKRSGGTSDLSLVKAREVVAVTSDSEFGDNVDLF
jgi:methyl-accepting chemotaxis protein